MWHGAMLFRSTKKMPKIDLFLRDRKKVSKGIDEAAIIQRMTAYQKRHEEHGGNN